MSDPNADPVGFLVEVVAAFKGGHKLLGGMLALVLAVWVARKFGGMLPGKAGQFLKSKAGGWTLSLVLGASGSLAVAAASGAPVTLGVVLAGLAAGFAAAGGWEGFKDVLPLLVKMFGGASPDIQSPEFAVPPVVPVPVGELPPSASESGYFGRAPSAEQQARTDALFTALGYVRQADGTYKKGE